MTVGTEGTEWSILAMAAHHNKAQDACPSDVAKVMERVVLLWATTDP